MFSSGNSVVFAFYVYVFDPAQINFCVERIVGVIVLFFFLVQVVDPVPLIKETFISSLNFIDTCLINQLTKYVSIYFWSLFCLLILG